MGTLNAEIISVGTELLLGHVTNTDARDVAEQLSKIGINVYYQTVVGDNPGRLRECAEIAKNRANLIITTGGLGPTCDDITKQVLCQTFGVSLVSSEEEVQALHDYISGTKEITKNNYQQALVPERGTVFHNTCGTAPGVAFEKDGTVVAMLPGPPKECNAMLNLSLIPYLKSFSDETIVSHSVNIFGIGESRVDDLLSEKMNAMDNPTMAPYAKECDCLVQITAKAKSEEEGEAMTRPVMDEVEQLLGDYVYGEDVENLEQAVVNCLKYRTVAIAEGFTGGAVSARFSSAAADTGCFAGSFIRQNLPASPEATAKVSETIREELKSDFALAILADETQDEGYITLTTPTETFTRTYDRKSNTRSHSFLIQMAGNLAFDMLRRYLTGKTVLI